MYLDDEVKIIANISRNGVRIIRNDRISQAKKWLNHLIYKCKDDEIVGLAAQLAYFLLLSLFPLLIFLITLLAYLPISIDGVLSYFYTIVPGDSYVVIEEFVVSILDTRRADILSISILTTIWSSSSGMSAIIRSLNKAYDVEESRKFIFNKLTSILMVIGIILALVIALVLSVFGDLIGDMIYTYLNVSPVFLTLWNTARLIGVLIILIIIFGLVYLIAPNKGLKIKNVYIGAIFSGIGWLVASFIFSFYVNNFANYSVTYGSLGGIIILMVWLYLSGIILIVGGEINATIDFFRKSKG